MIIRESEDTWLRVPRFTSLNKMWIINKWLL